MYVIELGYIKKKQFNTYSCVFIALKKNSSAFSVEIFF